MRMPISWHIERLAARFLIWRLRLWGHRCKTSDLEDFEEPWSTKGRCAVCLAHEAADALKELYI